MPHSVRIAQRATVSQTAALQQATEQVLAAIEQHQERLQQVSGFRFPPCNSKWKKQQAAQHLRQQ
jgi:hypothetical protein